MKYSGSSADEAYAYLTELKQTLQFVEVSTCDMEKGHLRCDANVSVRLRGAEKFGTKAEVKNVNSFRFVKLALDYEITRQIAVLESGGHIVQETRLFNVDTGEIIATSTKEATAGHLDTGERAMGAPVSVILARKGDDVATIQPDATLGEAASALTGRGIGALVVSHDGSDVIGVLSERDIVRAAVHNESLFTQTVSQLMTRNLILGTPADDVGAVGSTMLERRIRHLPVLDGGKLVGIVTIGDVVKAQRDQYQGEVDTLQLQLLGAPAASTHPG